MQDVLINILIRTSNRPALFTRCLRSIQRQTYKNVRIVVSYDLKEKPSYISSDLSSICVLSSKYMFAADEPAFYNRYCNTLMKEVYKGYAIFVDDDDFLNSDKRALETIVERLQPGKANIVQFKRNSRKKPLNGVIEHSKCGLPNLILHSDYKDLAIMGGQTDSDYYYIKEISDKLGINFIEQVLVCCDRRSYGRVS